MNGEIDGLLNLFGDLFFLEKGKHLGIRRMVCRLGAERTILAAGTALGVHDGAQVDAITEEPSPEGRGSF